MLTDLAALKDRFSEGVRGLAVVLRRPSLASAYFRRNPKIPAIVLFVFVAVPLALPAIDSLLARAYPPRFHEKLFGLLGTKTDSSLLDRRKMQVRWVLWATALASAGAILLLQVPKILRSAEAGTIGDPVGPASTQVVNPDPKTATKVRGRYALRGELGRGAMGVVYRGFDTVLEREVALKELPPHLASDPDRYQRFRREALTLARLSHPGIVQVFDLMEEDGRTFLAMELVHGGDLDDLVAARGSLSIPEVSALGLAVLDALCYVHSRGVVHRDLKPANILMGQSGLPKITDFGIARQEKDAGLTQEGSILGSPLYMSPEQATGGAVDYRSDLYSFGAILYWMLTGSPPFTGDAASVMAQHVSRKPAPVSSLSQGVPRDLGRAVGRLLAKDPEERAACLEDLRAALARSAAKGNS